VEKSSRMGYLDFKYLLHGDKESGPLSIAVKTAKEGPVRIKPVFVFVCLCVCVVVSLQPFCFDTRIMCQCLDVFIYFKCGIMRYPMSFAPYLLYPLVCHYAAVSLWNTRDMGKVTCRVWASARNRARIHNIIRVKLKRFCIQKRWDWFVQCSTLVFMSFLETKWFLIFKFPSRNLQN
jgi:hypothetical protein